MIAIAIFLDEKNQKSSRQIGFLALLAMPHKAGRTTGCNLFPLLRSLMARASGKTCYALPAAQPCTFCPLLAEADLLTGKGVANAEP
jgi:hypothetical protein